MSVTPDVTFTSDGSIVLMTPRTPQGESWIDEHLPSDCPMMGMAYAVEVNYAFDILVGMKRDGIDAVKVR